MNVSAHCSCPLSPFACVCSGLSDVPPHLVPPPNLTLPAVAFPFSLWHRRGEVQHGEKLLRGRAKAQRNHVQQGAVRCEALVKLVDPDMTVGGNVHELTSFGCCIGGIMLGMSVLAASMTLDHSLSGVLRTCRINATPLPVRYCRCRSRRKVQLNSLSCTWSRTVIPVF